MQVFQSSLKVCSRLARLNVQDVLLLSVFLDLAYVMLISYFDMMPSQLMPSIAFTIHSKRTPDKSRSGRGAKPREANPWARLSPSTFFLCQALFELETTFCDKQVYSNILNTVHSGL